MTKIDAALDRYEAAAKARGYRIASEGARPFDEAEAKAIFLQRHITENHEYFSVLRRWNGLHLETQRADGAASEIPAGLNYGLASFEAAYEQFDLFNGEKEEDTVIQLGGHFFILFDDGGNPIGFPTYSGGPELYIFSLQATFETELIFGSVSSALNTFASAIEAGLTLSSSSDFGKRGWLKEQLAYAKIGKSFNPGILSWDRAVQYYSQRLLETH